MSIGDLFRRDVVTCTRETPADEVAALMRSGHVGDLIVVDADDQGERPVGIITDRDLVLEVLAPQVDAQAVTAADIMSWELVKANVDDGVEEVIAVMCANGVRRLPIADEKGMLVGIVTVDDLIGWLAVSLKSLSRLTAREYDIERERRKQA
ncbi:MAG: CBS domain-containing protein [Gammaproteobacteria bacterium]|nr:CBS domain-containing protein [Gammaproteobacteria bacterium]